jgi:hypothetical protein
VTCRRGVDDGNSLTELKKSRVEYEGVVVLRPVPLCVPRGWPEFQHCSGRLRVVRTELRWETELWMKREGSLGGDGRLFSRDNYSAILE